MDGSIFRAYSIRGVAGQTLTSRDMELIGQALGTLLGEAALTTAVVGQDHRASSPELAAALKRGLLSAGMSLIDISACPTPLLNFATDHYQAGAGLMVTASHNPPQYNGLKIRTDHSLQGDELQAIYRAARQAAFRHGQGSLACEQPLDVYLDTICGRVATERALRFVVDAGNGAAAPVVPRLLAGLGHQVIPLYCEPDGRFPNRAPDPTAPGALDALSALVLAEHADAGFAYDGDADRIAMVDDTGRPAFADRLLALLAPEALAAHPGGAVVYEVSCTQALPEVVERWGGKAIPCPVGYAFVHARMREAGALLGGETSGHLFFAEPDFHFDDAMLATAKLAALLSRSQRPLSALLAALPQYAASPDRRFHCPDDRKQGVVADVRETFVARGYPVERMDGARIAFDGGWALFRASNTQPAVTLRCEARTAAGLAEIERVVLDAAREALRRAGVEMAPGTH
jgi:phosphomannomutase/phosphoglucomutase